MRMMQGILPPFQGSLRTKWSIFILCLHLQPNNSSQLVSPKPTHMELLKRMEDLWKRRRKVRAPAQMTGDSSSEPHGSVGTCHDFNDLKFKAIVCLLPICKQSEHSVLTHRAVLRMMKN